MLVNKVTLSQLIEINKLVSGLDKRSYDISVSDDSASRKAILQTNVFIQKAQYTYSYITGKSAQEIDTLSVDFLFSWYSDFLKSFDAPLVGRWWESAKLPEPELTHMTNITFGQFIDAKMIVDAGTRDGHDKWQIVQYIMSIFMLNKKQAYDNTFVHEKSRQFIKCGTMPAYTAIVVSRWWDLLNKYINDNYTVFQDPGDRRENSENMDEHMRRWGWVNFLKSIAKTKAFDISGSGMNSIDCVRATKASEILVWASEERESNTAASRDMKSVH